MLTPQQRASLVSFKGTPMYDAVIQVMNESVAKFLGILTATNPADPQAVTTNHQIYIAAAAFRQDVIDQINIEVEKMTQQAE